MGGGILTGGVYDSYMIFHTWLYMIPFSPWFYTWFYCVAYDFTRFLYFHKWFYTTPSFPHDSFISTWFLQSFIFLDDFTYNPSTYISTSFPYSHTWFYMIPFFFMRFYTTPYTWFLYFPVWSFPHHSFIFRLF